MKIMLMDATKLVNLVLPKEVFGNYWVVNAEKQNLVRAIDIANSMNYSKPSVSIALKKLKNDGYITVDSQNGNISLTPQGKEIALSI